MIRSSFIFLEDKNVMIVKINYVKGTSLYTLLRLTCHSHENEVLREPQLPPLRAHDHISAEVLFLSANFYALWGYLYSTRSLWLDDYPSTWSNFSANCTGI